MASGSFDMTQNRIIKKNFDTERDDEKYKKIANEILKDDKSEISEGYRDLVEMGNLTPQVIVDPRMVGFGYPSYIFIETKSQLTSGFEADLEDFDNPKKALMTGITLGDVDVVHRRVDEDKYRGATFAKEAKTGNDLKYFEEQETSPINEIIRWHGQDVISDNYLSGNTTRIMNDIRYEVLRELMEDPTKPADRIADNIRIRVDNGLELDSINHADDITEREIKSQINTLKGPVILGYSVGFRLDPTKWHHALMGISVEPGAAAEDDEHKDHGAVVEHLRKIDNFKMPYITSGIGQQWGDIITELFISEINEVNEISKDLREYDEVESTRTYLFTQTNFNRSWTDPEFNVRDICDQCYRVE